jgi:hypothetical protein
MTRRACSISLLFGALLMLLPAAQAEPQQDEFWEAHPQFEQMRPHTIAVLPMDNFTLEEGVEQTLYQEVYARPTM